MLVRGTMEIVPEIEVSVDTVYIRTNVVRIEEDEFTGWEYNEVQIPKDRYIEQIANEKALMQQALDDLILGGGA